MFGLNASADATNAIQFNIAGAGVRTIALAAALPNLTRPVSLEAWTQGGAGYSGVPLIELDGAGASTGNGVTLQGISDSLVRGPIIGGFSGGAGVLDSGGSSNTSQGDCIGTNSDGTAAHANNLGMAVENASADTLVGTDADGVADTVEGNLPSGNAAQGRRRLPLPGQSRGTWYPVMVVAMR